LRTNLLRRLLFVCVLRKDGIQDAQNSLGMNSNVFGRRELECF
jgi:hypothetical protein